MNYKNYTLLHWDVNKSERDGYIWAISIANDVWRRRGIWMSDVCPMVDKFEKLKWDFTRTLSEIPINFKLYIKATQSKWSRSHYCLKSNEISWHYSPLCCICIRNSTFRFIFVFFIQIIRIKSKWKLNSTWKLNV